MDRKLVRETMMGVIDHYIDTQPGGVKLIKKQLEIFHKDCLWVSFSDPNVVPGGGLKQVEGKDDFQKLCEAYNEYASSLKALEIDYQDKFVDETAKIAGFTLHIKMVDQQNQACEFLNTLHLHLDESYKVVKAYNWMGAI